MNRYRWRTFGLELVMIAVALVVGFPLYVLVNLAVRAPSENGRRAVSIVAPSPDACASRPQSLTRPSETSIAADANERRCGASARRGIGLR